MLAQARGYDRFNGGVFEASVQTAVNYWDVLLRLDQVQAWETDKVQAPGPSH
jgi:hypothetical protein